MTRNDDGKQGKIVLTTIDDLVAPNHFLRALATAIDFSFIYDIVKPLYSAVGRPSVDPVVLIKMLLIGYLFGIDSERKLVEEVQYNIAYRWFLGIDLDERVPNHSVFSQNRRRRFKGKEVFRQVFEAVVQKCMEAGLVKGEDVVMDSTHIKANADNHNMEWVQLTKTIDSYWLDLMDQYPMAGEPKLDNECVTTVKSKNPCDPDAEFMNRTGKPKGFHYLNHQCSDADTGIILDTKVTAGDVQDCECCVDRFAYLKFEKCFPIENAGLDSAYDTIAIHHGLTELGIKGYISMCDRGNGIQSKDGMLTRSAFVFDIENDRYICPNECFLTFRGIKHQKGTPLKTYAARTKDCNACQLKPQCFKGKNNYRIINRHIYQNDRDVGLARIGTFPYERMRRKRQIVCEGNFALQKRCHNMRCTRKRGIENVEEQCLFSAMALNLKRLVKYGRKQLEATAVMAAPALTSYFLRVYRFCRTMSLV